MFCMIMFDMHTYAQGGSYPEGAAYWNYGAGFMMMAVCGLESAFGNSGGIAEHPGFLESGRFILHSVAPSGLVFNFSDCSEHLGSFPALLWYAKRSGELPMLWDEKRFHSAKNNYSQLYSLLPMLPLFASDIDFKKITKPAEKFLFCEKKNPVFMARTGWDDKNAAFIGVKGGAARIPHGHMDAGSFIFEIGGVRWAADLGTQEYGRLEKKGVDLFNMKQDSQRWKLMCYSNLSHSTITINGGQHRVGGFAKITEVYGEDARLGAKVDMAETLGPDVESALREVVLLDGKRLVVTDKIKSAGAGGEIRWNMCAAVDALPEILPGGEGILLKNSGKILRVSAKGGGALRPFVRAAVPENDAEASLPNRFS